MLFCTGSWQLASSTPDTLDNLVCNSIPVERTWRPLSQRKKVPWIIVLPLYWKRIMIRVWQTPPGTSSDWLSTGHTFRRWKRSVFYRYSTTEMKTPSTHYLVADATEVPLVREFSLSIPCFIYLRNLWGGSQNNRLPAILLILNEKKHAGEQVTPHYALRSSPYCSMFYTIRCIATIDSWFQNIWRRRKWSAIEWQVQL
jgi:hypothetical protein